MVSSKLWDSLRISKYDPTKCDVPNCLVEQNTTLADIVVLRHSDLPYSSPIEKEGNQIWVLHTGECPHHTIRPPSKWAKHIDLGASYMEQSDFFVPIYGRVKLRKAGTTRNFTGILKSKRRDAVWVSSHCNTHGKRENLVIELAKYMNVDTYGTCGKKKCGRQYDDLKKCAETFVQDYKFYFAFENSICDNYTTEKLYSLFRDRAPIIPVINGPRDVRKYLPEEHILTDSISLLQSYWQRNWNALEITNPSIFVFCKKRINTHFQMTSSWRLFINFSAIFVNTYEIFIMVK